VNATHLAKARGIEVVEERRTPAAGAYASLVTLFAEARGRRWAVAGTIANGEQRLVRIDDYRLDMAPASHMLFTSHHDRPGVVGHIGALLGAADVNISAMVLARTAPRAEAIMLLALDDTVPDDVVARIRTEAGIIDVWVVQLGRAGAYQPDAQPE